MSFKELAASITQLFGDLNTHIQNLEGLEKDIDKESRASGRPSVAFKLNDLRSLLHDVLIKVCSYKRCCQDIADFGNSYDTDLKTQEELLSFLKEMSSFSFLLKKRLDAIITDTEKAENALMEHKSSKTSNSLSEAASKETQQPSNNTTSQMQPTPPEAEDISASKETQQPSNKTTSQMQPTTPEAEDASAKAHINWRKNPCQWFYNKMWSTGHAHSHSQNATLDECLERLEKLRVEVKQLNEGAVAIYSKHIMKCLEIDDVKILSDGIKQITDKCKENLTVLLREKE